MIPPTRPIEIMKYVVLRQNVKHVNTRTPDGEKALFSQITFEPWFPPGPSGVPEVIEAHSPEAALKALRAAGYPASIVIEPYKPTQESKWQPHRLFPLMRKTSPGQ